jgi:tRNA (cmo5U34)-methyltransferase
VSDPTDHWDPGSYPDVIREEIPDYDRLQAELAAAVRGRTVRTILELGTGSGETTRRVLELYPDAHLRGIDSSEAMLSAAREALSGAGVDLELRRLEDPLPSGPYDLVVSALAVHHLDHSGKADLFQRIANVLEPEGRFVLADVVVPDDPRDAITPLEAGYDIPSGVPEQIAWLREAGLRPRVHWRRRDLVVLIADTPST